MDKPTLPEDRAIDMASRYNEALRRHLGLPPLPDRPGARAASTAEPARFALVPFLGGGQIGLGLCGRF